MLGCGAHVTYLRRVGVSHYPASRMVTLEQLEALIEQAKEQNIEPDGELLDPLLLPMDTAVQDLPEVNMNEVMANHVQHGQPVQIAGRTRQKVLFV